MKPANRNVAAVSLIITADGLILCVWNRHFKGFTLPGGKVEDKESIRQAQRRELEEETGLLTKSATLVYVAPNLPVTVHVFRVEPTRPMAESIETSVRHKAEACVGIVSWKSVAWKTRDEFLDCSPFREFYLRMVAAGVDTSPTFKG